MTHPVQSGKAADAPVDVSGADCSEVRSAYSRQLRVEDDIGVGTGELSLA